MFDSLDVRPGLAAKDELDRLLKSVEPKAVSEALRKVLLKRADPLGCIVTEENYRDVDYSSSFFLQRGRTFAQSPRYTKRVHAFSCIFDKVDLEEPSNELLDKLKRSYLGSFVIRPLDPPTIGRAFIKPPEQIEDANAFFPTKRRIEVDLCGIRLEVDACPFISADPVSMACATASIWMSTSSLANKVGLPEYTTSEITALALSLSRPFGPSLANRGLATPEAERAFAAMGFDPLTWEYPSVEDLHQACYSYTESGVPIVLFLYVQDKGYHAITVVGYLMDTLNHKKRKGYRLFDKNEPLVSPDYYDDIYSLAEFIPGFVVNDDQQGIYLRAEIRARIPKSQKGNSKNGRRKEPHASKTDPSKAELWIWDGEGVLRTGYCIWAMVPLPPRVALPARSAVRTAAQWLSVYVLGGLIQKRPLILRPYLLVSKKLKQSYLKSPRGSPEVCLRYRATPLPHLVWVIEYGFLEDWAGAPPDKLEVQGEFLIDASQTASQKPNFLFIHRRGVLVRQSDIGGQQEPLQGILEDDAAYYCYLKDRDLSVRP